MADRTGTQYFCAKGVTGRIKTLLKASRGAKLKDTIMLLKKKEKKDIILYILKFKTHGFNDCLDHDVDWIVILAIALCFILWFPTIISSSFFN